MRTSNGGAQQAPPSELSQPAEANIIRLVKFVFVDYAPPERQVATAKRSTKNYMITTY